MNPVKGMEVCWFWCWCGRRYADDWTQRNSSPFLRDAQQSDSRGVMWYFEQHFQKYPKKIITNNLEQPVQWPGSCIQRGNTSPAVFYLYEKCQFSKIFFPFTLRSENHPFWDVRVRNTCFLRSASLLVEKHFCRIHYSFSICHSCQVIDLLLMTSQKSLSFNK